MSHIYEALLQLQRNGEQGVLVTVVEKEGSGPLPPGAKMLVYPDGRTIGTVGGGRLEQLAQERAAELIRTKRSMLVRYALFDERNVAEADEATNMVCGGRVTLFYEYLTSGPHVYLFGGGHVGQALVRHLRDLPYFVTVIDEREGTEGLTPGADRVIVAAYETALQNIGVPEGSFFVIATPAHDADYLVLRTILTSHWQPRYIALLASRAKSAKFIHDLRAELGENLDLSALYTPAGLDIGGTSADEIAISIIAEMQALRYGRSGQKHLRAAATNP
jgi:xanthine dehydrogenase accessory factor